MTLRSTPAVLTCVECEDEIADAGYLPATEYGDGYEPMPDEAVCGACGFNDIGMAGCAPELADVADPDTADVLLYIQPTDTGVEVVSVN